MSRRLVLFDIDGTLLSAGGASRRAFETALREVFGAVGSVADYDYSGKTDPQIVRDLMQSAGFTDAEIRRRLPLALERYRKSLAGSMRPEEVREQPGVRALLEALESDARVTLGLLTGNIEPNARLKLAPLDANRFFAFGAFGSDHEDRYRLPGIALERAREAVGITFAGPEVAIVGDSVHDVLCGRDLGVRAVAVATGRTSAERLAAVGPDTLLTDFSDTHASLAAILDGA